MSIQMMKAAVYHRYGSPDVISIAEVEKPTPKDNEVIIKVHAASVNAADWHLLRADTPMIRLASGLSKPKYAIPGSDVAGVAEAVGQSVKAIKAGDEIYGCLSDISGNGSFAEYVCADEKVLAPKPSCLTFEEAAAVPLAAVTALQGLRDSGKITPGKKVLVNGASGGVGTFAVQIAKHFGAEVTGVCSARNIEMAQSIGADFTVDYEQEDFTKADKRYDLILDIVANHTLSDYKRVMTPNGICVIVGFSSLGNVLKVMLGGSFGGKKIKQLIANNKNKEDLIYLNRLFENGTVKPVIDSCYPLEDISNAFWYFEKEHAKGKIVIQVAS